jgi:glycosyltransferase involved in cell wall biosynthesis
MERVKIAIFTDTFFPQVNGVSQYLKEMVRYMEQHAIEYRLFVPGNKSAAEEKHTTAFKSISFYPYPEIKIGWPDDAVIRGVLDDFKPDIIYLATQISVGLAGLKYARRNRVPIIAAYHTDFPGYLYYYRLGVLRPLVWKYLKWFHSYGAVNICPSMPIFEQLLSQGIHNLTTGSSGIDYHQFSPSRRSDMVRREYAPDGELILLYVGRLAPEKDLQVLLKACEKMRSDRSNFKLLVIGDGPSRNQMAKQDLPGVIFTGYKGGIELSEIYASADVFVFPSPTETFGTVVLEAMASGLPVVAAYAGGVKESLYHMSNGLAFKPGEDQEMADCITRLMDDPTLRQELALRARSFALSRTWENTFIQFFLHCQNAVKHESSPVLIEPKPEHLAVNS